uniref:Uncharacterized protein n=1 Tax=Chromera velia CCMP2878 TaxID=1169474 RepID=A0A0G4F6I9_9ALVE|eukprot:Cvel_15454.t1-p1 / transcript=Cvel_15454.t1 / gene=Cvel_15454 / organism=Chromera_velia_CCMP2878 / gene_product=hypothetical protein / transcript_product=hypothetical protein / location=Cvel_scaffold1144:42032-45921(+) / protein_length=139 / sequence_SO=supercontig / SO=protein_coding / is_pseudo=false
MQASRWYPYGSKNFWQGFFGCEMCGGQGGSWRACTGLGGGGTCGNPSSLFGWGASLGGGWGFVVGGWDGCFGGRPLARLTGGGGGLSIVKVCGYASALCQVGASMLEASLSSSLRRSQSWKPRGQPPGVGGRRLEDTSR